ncbi:MAG: EAL domain-containing protein [Burkholderiaceae bacterium]
MPPRKETKKQPKGGAETLPTLVAIGSSAGGLEALRTMVANLPAQGNYAYLVAQHISPNHKSMMSELLSREAPHLRFVDLRERLKPAAQTVYVTPPNFDLIVRKGFLELIEPTQKFGPKPSADHLFLSLAESVGADAIGIVLSGTGSDGAQGVRAIRARGGITIAQDPETAKFAGMPSAAIQIGNADLILSAEQIGPYLAQYATDGVRPRSQEIDRSTAFDEVLGLVQEKHQVDFTQYKRDRITHQIARRMQTLAVDSLEQYLEQLREIPAEVDRLYQSFLKSVTAFFKDEQAWQILQQAFTARIANLPIDKPIRVWVAGCASGEEAYSLAILLNELQLELQSKRKVKVFATDLDEQSLEIARVGVYPEVYVDQQVIKSLKDRYFTRQGRSYRISKSLRDTVVFARHNLVGDPVFHNVDLICCRNVFCEFEPSLQSRLLKSFHKAIQSEGFLFLGVDEPVETDGEFKLIEGGVGLYQRVSATLPTNELPPIVDRVVVAKVPGADKTLKPADVDLAVEEAKALILRRYAPISVLIDESFGCKHFFGDMRKLLSIGNGSANLNLPGLLPQDMKSPVRALLNRASKENREVDLTLRRSGATDDLNHLRAVVRPVVHAGQQSDHYLASFEQLGDELLESAESFVDEDQVRQANSRLERELMSTQQSLQAVIEEIESSNEELLALNEELQANAEELAASNEELQTSNEQLQGSNEELQTLNDELHFRSAELSSANSYLENLQSAVDVALIVVDEALRVQRYTPAIGRVFEVLQTDIGRPLSTLTSVFDVATIESKIRWVMANLRQHSERVIHGSTTWLLRVNPYFDGAHIVGGAVVSFTDVTELSIAQHELTSRTAALEMAADGMLLVDIENDAQPIVYVSDAFCSLTGYSQDEVLGRNCRFLQGANTDREQTARLGQAIRKKESASVEIINYRKDGTQFWNALKVSPVLEAGGVVRRYVGLIAEISDRKGLELSTIKRANYDALTGLANRTLLLSRLERAISMSERHDEHCYVMFIDLDGFKAINDQIGHEAGDQMLVEVASRLESSVRETDTVARLGGDEFVVVLSEVPGLEAVIRLATSLLGVLRKPCQLDGQSHRVSASLGVAVYPQDATTANELLRCADKAMYRSKAAGKNRFAFYQTEMNEDAAERSAIKQAIFGGLEARQFELVYQPIVEIEQGQIVAAEALLRWRHPTRGLLEPSSFLALAQETGQMLPIGRWVLETAAKQSHNWTSWMPEGFRVTVNLSLLELGDQQTFGLIESLPDDLIAHLEFDISETSFAERSKSVLQCVELIRSKGGRVSLDDFGAGYSSLQFLLAHPVDAIKIAPSFVQADMSLKSNVQLLEAVAMLARGIGAEVIAEGVETKEQVSIVRRSGCCKAQGFFFSPPISASEVQVECERFCLPALD